MADQKSRGGKKQGQEKGAAGKKHQSTHPGDTHRQAERGGQGPGRRRKPTARHDEEEE